MELGIAILAIIVIFGLREVYCWYSKQNLILKEQKETNRLLRKIAGETEEPTLPEVPQSSVNEGGAVSVEEYNKRLYG